MQWPSIYTSSIRDAYCRNAPLLWRKQYKIEAVWYCQFFEIDSSIHASSVSTLNEIQYCH